MACRQRAERARALAFPPQGAALAALPPREVGLGLASAPAMPPLPVAAHCQNCGTDHTCIVVPQTTFVSFGTHFYLLKSDVLNVESS